MDILMVAVAALVLGALALVAMGPAYGPFVFIAVLIVGALIANRRGYRHQARAIRGEFDGRTAPPPAPAPTPQAPPPTPQAPPRDFSARLADVERLRRSGDITDAEADRLRAAILADV